MPKFINTAPAVKKRLNYCMDLLNLNALNPEHLLAKDQKIRSIRQDILRNAATSENQSESSIYLASPKEALAFIREQISTITSMDTSNKANMAKKAEKLLYLKGFIDIQHFNFARNRQLSRSYGISNQLIAQIDEMTTPELLDALNSETINSAKIDEDTLKNIESLAARRKELQDQYGQKSQAIRAEMQQKFDPLFVALRDKVIELGKKKSALRESYLQGEVPAEEVNKQFTEMDNQLQQCRDEQKIINDQYRAEYQKSINEVKGRFESDLSALNEENSKLHEQVFNSVLAQSSVTMDQAIQWAEKQVDITERAQRKLKNLGYDRDSFKQDLIDFYRMTNGRLGNVQIDSENTNRAYATGIGDHGGLGVVMIDNTFSKEVLWHELAHHLESDAKLLHSAKQYIKSRSVDGGKLHTLRSLTGKKVYKTDEKAYKTEMFSNYAAKYYDTATEVFSMGVQYLTGNGLGYAYAKDPETFKFVIGSLMQPHSQEYKLNKSLRDEIFNFQESGKESSIAAAQATFENLAKLIEFTPSTDMTWLPELDLERLKNIGAEQLGYMKLPTGEKLAILKSSKVDTVLSNRRKKGIIALLLDDAYEANKELNEYFTVKGLKVYFKQYPTVRLHTQDLDAAKVLLLGHFENNRVYRVGLNVVDLEGQIGKGYLNEGFMRNVLKKIGKEQA